MALELDASDRSLDLVSRVVWPEATDVDQTNRVFQRIKNGL